MSRPHMRQRAMAAGVTLITEEHEAALCKVALLRCNLSKLKESDVSIFTSVVEREFPQVLLQYSTVQYSTRNPERTFSAAPPFPNS